MLESGSSYLEVRACLCSCPQGDALLTPPDFLRTCASGEASPKDWPVLLFLVLTQYMEHLGDKKKAKLYKMSVIFASCLFYGGPIFSLLASYGLGVLCSVPDPWMGLGLKPG